jgi:RimJ/RimL family protein N-acetyltransferase
MTHSDPLPTFTTARLILRSRTRADRDACLAMDRDPLVTKFIPGPWTDAIAHRAFVEARIRHAYPPDMGYWSIRTSTGFTSGRRMLRRTPPHHAE